MSEFRYHAAAGNKIIPHPEGVHVYLIHEGVAESGAGCGALGHLNPAKAEHAVHELWHGIEALKVNPEAYFGMGQEQLAAKVKGLNLPEHAFEHARNILNQTVAKNIPAIVGVFSHEAGTITHVGEFNLPEAPGIIHFSICSDARVPEKAAIKYYEKVLKGLKSGSTIELGGVVATNPQTQAPKMILVHRPEEKPNKRDGKIFSVSSSGELGLDERLSIAYALVNFGPHGSKALKKIIVTQQQTHDNLQTLLAGMKGVRLVLKT